MRLPHIIHGRGRRPSMLLGHIASRILFALRLRAQVGNANLIPSDATFDLDFGQYIIQGLLTVGQTYRVLKYNASNPQPVMLEWDPDGRVILMQGQPYDFVATDSAYRITTVDGMLEAVNVALYLL